MPWPLCYTYRRSIIGNGFVAHVEFCGRTLAVPEADGVWLFGVSPAAVAVGGSSLADAHRSLHEAVTKVLIDFAEAAHGFSEFEQTVRAFYEEADADLAEWEAAVASIKQGQTAPPEGIRRCPDPDLFLKVIPKKIEQLTAADNPLTLREETQADFAVA